MECSKEGELAAIKTDLKTVYKEVMGNGADGLAKSVVKLQSHLEQQEESNRLLTESFERMRTAMSGIEKSYIVIEATARENEKRKIDNRWLVRTLLIIGGLFLTFIGYVYFN